MKVFYCFSEPLHTIPFGLVLLQNHSHLHHYISQAPNRKQKHIDYLKQRKFKAESWLHMMEEAEKPTREQTINPEISNFRKLPPPLGLGEDRGRMLLELRSHQKKLKGLSLGRERGREISWIFSFYLLTNLPLVPPIDQTSWRPADTQSLQPSARCDPEQGRGRVNHGSEGKRLSTSIVICYWD